jgi:hypothetical protein
MTPDQLQHPDAHAATSLPAQLLKLMLAATSLPAQLLKLMLKPNLKKKVE